MSLFLAVSLIAWTVAIPLLYVLGAAMILEKFEKYMLQNRIDAKSN